MQTIFVLWITYLLCSTHGAFAFMACISARLVYYHIPKTGGMSMNRLLWEKPYHCFRLGWDIEPADSKSLYAGYDAAHVSPLEFPKFVKHNVSTLKDWNDRTGINPVDVVNHWHSFTVVRNPYLRVLGSYEQRMWPMYNKNWPNDYPKPPSFLSYLRWLDGEISSGRMTWEKNPTLTHFRPCNMYTHDGNGTQIIGTILKLESINEELPQFLSNHFHGPEIMHPSMRRENGGNPGSENRTSLCIGVGGCEETELQVLLNQTRHTEETIRLTNRIYKKDFELFGYRMLLPDDPIAIETI